MNIEHLKMLVLSADLGSFSACARRMGKVQSAVSHGISNLEADFNIELFDRSTRKPSLTEEGKRIYDRAKIVLAQLDDLESINRSIQNNEESRVIIAVDCYLLTEYIYGVFERFFGKYPNTQLELQSYPSQEIVGVINSGKASIGIMISDLVVDKNILSRYVGNVEFIPVCHCKSELTQKTSVNVLDLSQYRQISIRGQETAELIQNPSFTDKVFWCNNVISIISLLKENIGWAYMPKHIVKPMVDSNELAIISVSFDKKPWTMPVEVLMTKDIKAGPALNWLFNEFTDVLLNATL